MADRVLKLLLTWGLFAITALLFGIAAAAYFVFTSLVLGLVYNQIFRRDIERQLLATGVSAEEVDGRMLPRDRAIALGRAAAGLLVAGLFYRFA